MRGKLSERRDGARVGIAGSTKQKDGWQHAREDTVGPGGEAEKTSIKG